MTSFELVAFTQLLNFEYVYYVQDVSRTAFI
jgi:hypothetical protein